MPRPLNWKRQTSLRRRKAFEAFLVSLPDSPGHDAGTAPQRSKSTSNGPRGPSLNVLHEELLFRVLSHVSRGSSRFHVASICQKWRDLTLNHAHSLTLVKASVKSALFQDLGCYSNLTSLHIPNVLKEVSIWQLSHLSTLTTLKHLRIDCPIVESPPPPPSDALTPCSSVLPNLLQLCPLLESVKLPRLEASYSLPQHLPTLPSLHTLNLTGWPWDDREIEPPLPYQYGGLKIPGCVETAQGLGSLTALKEMSFSSRLGVNDLGNAFCSLTRLTSLSLDIPYLLSLPQNLGQLKNLSILPVLSERLTELPESVSQLTKLTSLQLDCMLLSSLPDSLGTFSALRVLRVRSNVLTALPSSLASLTELRELDLICPNLISLPESIGLMQKLKLLQVHSPKLTHLPEALGFLWDLEDLSLDCSELQNIPEGVGRLPRLRMLDVTGCPGTCNMPLSLWDAPSLRMLAGGDALSKLFSDVLWHAAARSAGENASMSHSGPPSLQQVHLRYADVAQVAFPKGMQGVRVLTLRSCENLLRVGLRKEDMGSLKVLKYLDCQAMTTLVLPPSVESLHIIAWGNDSAFGIPEELGSLAKLRVLELRMIEELTSLPRSFSELTTLESLVLEDLSIARLPPGMEWLVSLKSLELLSLPNLKVFPQLVELHRLDKLVVNKCGALKALFSARSALCIRLLKLKSVEISRCKRLVTLDRALGARPGLEVLELNKLSSLQTLPSFKGLSCLTELSIVECPRLKELPQGMESLRALRSLTLKELGKLERLPDSLLLLTQLQELFVVKCGIGLDVPRGLAELPCLSEASAAHMRSVVGIPCPV